MSSIVLGMSAIIMLALTMNDDDENYTGNIMSPFRLHTLFIKRLTRCLAARKQSYAL